MGQESSNVTAESRDLSRYKSYPISHFSRWRKWVQWFTVHCMINVFLYFKYHPKVYGQKNTPKTGPFIVAANHISMLDPPLVSYSVNYTIAYMAKKELFQNKLAAEFYRMQGCFALDRENPDSATLKTALNVLKSPAKWALGIFPEGTRSIDGKILPLRKGIGSMAKKMNVPVLPVGIYQDDTGKYVVTIGKLITDIDDPDKTQDLVYQALVHLTDPSWDRRTV